MSMQVNSCHRCTCDTRCSINEKNRDSMSFSTTLIVTIFLLMYTSTTRCQTCPDGMQATGNGKCEDCQRGYYSNAETSGLCIQCLSGFYSTTNRTTQCTPCRACPDGYYRARCSVTAGGGTCVPCLACGSGLVNVGCMNRAGYTDQAGTCRNRSYVVRTPLCDQKDSGLGLGGYTFLSLFGVSQDDASFQCRRRCDNEQNVLSGEVYTDNATFTELLRQFPNANGKPRAFDGGQCGGPYACDVANCNIPGSSDDSQLDYQPKLACPVYIQPAMANAFWTAVDRPGGRESSAVHTVEAMRGATCQTCASCGSGAYVTPDWGRGCARDCTQLSCQTGFIFDWTEPVQAAKCKPCGDLDDIRLCLSSEQNVFDGYDVSGRLPKVYMKNCRPKRQLPMRGYETDYGNCVKCADHVDACVGQPNTYYHTCEESGAGIIATCKQCSRSNGRTPTTGRYWDGGVYKNLYCQQQPCSVSAGLSYTGINTEAMPHRICHAICKPIVCDGDMAQVILPCVLPHQRRCKAAINMDTTVNDAEYSAKAYTPAHINVLEPNTTELHLFANFENVLIDHDAQTIALRAQCVWNSDFIPDNSVNPAGISSYFQGKCRPWARDPRMQYPIIPLQNTVSSDTADARVFPRRVLINTSTTAVAYSQGSLQRPEHVFAGDVYLELDLFNTNNATLVAFIPNDRGIETARWVPRWRASIYAQQIVGDNTNLSLVLDHEQTCFSCFSLSIFPQTPSSWITVNTTTATAFFRGDKFVFSPSPGLLVCEKSVQARAYPAFIETRYDASLSAMFASSLTDACVSQFGINSQDIGTSPVLLRSTLVIQSGNCIIYAFSSVLVYCIRRTGGIVPLAWPTRVEGAIVDVAIHNGILVRTMHSGLFSTGESTNYISLLSTIDSISETVVQVTGLIMFARGAPEYFLRRTTANSLRLSKFETNNSHFSLNATASYRTNDVKIVFSRFVPVSAKNTLFEYGNGFLVFATAKYSDSRVFVYVTALDTTLVELTTYSMPFTVFVVVSSEKTQKIDDPYENIEHVGEAFLSCTWLEKQVLLLSVSIEGMSSGKFSKLILNVTDLTLFRNELHPDLLRSFDAPFVRVANAILSTGKLLSCSECTLASKTSSSGFFAYGLSRISYRRLFTCDKQNTYIEEDTAKSFPVKTCGAVVHDSGNIYSTTMKMTFHCDTSNTSNMLEVVLDLPPNHDISFGQGKIYVRQEQTRILLSIFCDNGKAKSVKVFDNDKNDDGYDYQLWDGGSLNLKGGISVESIRHRQNMSSVSSRWDRRVVLLGQPRSVFSSSRVTRQWREYSITSRSILPLQQIDVRATRDVSIAWLASSKDTEQRLAMDALAVVPVISEHFMPVVFNNSLFLASIVYVPTSSDLRLLALETLEYGDDILDWKRLHASVHISNVVSEIRQCSYITRVVAVDNNMQMLAGPSTTANGCLIDLTLSPQCHIEIPQRLANTERIVGLLIHPTNGCRSLSNTDDISVEFTPFMKISQCPPNFFLHADTLRCTACDAGEVVCPSGKHVLGCRPLIHPSVTPQCVNCNAPNNSVFPSTSRGCAAWQCVSGFYRLGGACTRCTSLLRSACRATGGLKHQNCTAFENEKCVDCAPKPRYSEWTVSTKECTWKCKPGYFESDGGCEACQTFDETFAFLVVSGTRANGAFYRFQACSGTTQARAEVCASGDFGFSLDGVYIADGRSFGEDCRLQCAENSNLHSVRANLTRAGVVWTAQRCVQCNVADWPLSVNSVPLPRDAFEMSSSCVATCVRSAGYFAHANRSRTCLFCPQGVCEAGFFFSSQDNCAACRACVKTLTGGIFTASGAFDDAYSCPQTCPVGHFTANKETCRPHSVLACRDGLQYFVAGTASSDARCGTCADCSGAKEIAPCTPTTNRVCESCGPIDTWSSTWSRSGCQLMCRAELGYTKLYPPGEEICRKCTPCPLGHTLPDRPANCNCVPCSVNIPPTAVYTKGCEWTCPLYHVPRLNAAGALVCEYTIRQLPSITNHLRSASPVTCPPGQRLTHDPRPAAYAALVCENCSTPPGMRIEDLNVTWLWDRSCAWQCAWGLDKQATRGYFACETLRYTHKLRNQTSDYANSGLLTEHIIGIVVGAVVFMVVSICFVCRMLQE
jgi:hypothetical protein